MALSAPVVAEVMCIQVVLSLATFQLHELPATFIVKLSVPPLAENVCCVGCIVIVQEPPPAVVVVLAGTVVVGTDVVVGGTDVVVVVGTVVVVGAAS